MTMSKRDGPSAISNMSFRDGLSFKDSAELNNYISRMERSEEKLLCPFRNCTKRFERSYNLKVHVRKHTGDRPYKCKFPNCTLSFKWRSSLAAHHKGSHKIEARSDEKSNTNNNHTGSNTKNNSSNNNNHSNNRAIQKRVAEIGVSKNNQPDVHSIDPSSPTTMMLTGTLLTMGRGAHKVPEPSKDKFKTSPTSVSVTGSSQTLRRSILSQQPSYDAPSNPYKISASDYYQKVASKNQQISASKTRPKDMNGTASLKHSNQTSESKSLGPYQIPASEYYQNSASKPIWNSSTKRK